MCRIGRTNVKNSNLTTNPKFDQNLFLTVRIRVDRRVRIFLDQDQEPSVVLHNGRRTVRDKCYKPCLP